MAEIAQGTISNREGAQAVAAGRRNMDDFKRATSNSSGKGKYQDAPNEGGTQYMQEAAALSDQVAQQNFNRDARAYDIQSQRQNVNQLTQMQFAQGGQLGWAESQRLANEGELRQRRAAQQGIDAQDKLQARDWAGKLALAGMQGGGDGTPGSQLFGGSGSGNFPSSRDLWASGEENKRLGMQLQAQKDLAAMQLGGDRYRTAMSMTKGQDSYYWR